MVQDQIVAATIALFVISDNPFSKTKCPIPIRISGMDPPQTKKQIIKNQKQKGASEHRLGSAKHIRIRENEPREPKKKGNIGQQ